VFVGRFILFLATEPLLVSDDPPYPPVPPRRSDVDIDQRVNSTGMGLLVSEAVCLVLVVAGLLVMASPFFTAGGLVGWYHGYQLNQDVLFIGWFGTTAASVALGFGLAVAAALTGITIGIVGGVSLIGRRPPGSYQDHPHKHVEQSRS
jgi:hypothetical protein